MNRTQSDAAPAATVEERAEFFKALGHPARLLIDIY